MSQTGPQDDPPLKGMISFADEMRGKPTLVLQDSNLYLEKQKWI